MEKIRIVGSDDDRHNQRTQDVEYDQAIDEASACLGDVASRGLALTGGNGDCFGRQDECETRADERGPEREELPHGPEAGLGVAVERAGIFPVAEAESIVGGSAAEEEHDAEDDETQDGDDLDRGEPELGLAVYADRKDVENDDGG